MTTKIPENYRKYMPENTVEYKPLFDSINSPKHYTNGDIEVIDFMLSQFGWEAVRSFCILNANKYISRHSLKNGDEDLKKAIWYLRFAVGDDPRKDNP